jgi:dCMP deaminase
MKRPSWDEYYLSMAMIASTRSKDPSTQVGAVLVGRDHSFVQPGYNGLPRQVRDEPDVLGDRKLRLLCTIHAELNALHMCHRDVRGSTCYVYPLPPCAACTAHLIQAGVERFVSIKPTPELAARWGGEDAEMATWMRECAGVKLELVEM